MKSEYNTDIKTYQNLECVAQDVSNKKFGFEPDMSQDLPGIYWLALLQPQKISLNNYYRVYRYKNMEDGKNYTVSELII